MRKGRFFLLGTNTVIVEENCSTVVNIQLIPLHLLGY